MYKQYYKDICYKTGGEPSIYWDEIYKDNDTWQAITGDYETKVKWIYCRFYECLYKPVSAMLNCRDKSDDVAIKEVFADIALIGCASLLQGCEALGRFVNGKGYITSSGNKFNAESFNAFVEEYLLKGAKIDSALSKNELRDILREGFRNSLAHGLFVLKGGLSASNGELLAWKQGTNRTVISFEILLKLFKIGMDKYFAVLLELNSDKKRDFEDAFNNYVEHVKAKG